MNIGKHLANNGDPNLKLGIMSVQNMVIGQHLKIKMVEARLTLLGVMWLLLLLAKQKTVCLFKS